MILLATGCNKQDKPRGVFTGREYEIQIMTLNPGHFHAALLQMNMNPMVAPTVYVFAPNGPDLSRYVEHIEGFNTRDKNPTNWKLETYSGPDYLEHMLNERHGNVVVTAGNNRLKTDYLHLALENGINVLSDKPMAIDTENWHKLRSAFQIADENNALLYDIMTERHEITSHIQRILAQNRELFGQLETGSKEHPAIVKKSIHHLYKTVSGTPLRRPPWYFDVNQQGEGIVDVTTHLVDLSLWGAFPDEPIYYDRDINMLSASRWPTILTRQEFENITGTANFPGYLDEQLIDGALPYYCNGELDFTLRGHHVHISVQWNYQAPPGGGDSHYSKMRGSLTNLIIRQGEEQNFQSTLFVEPAVGADIEHIKTALANAVETLQDTFPGISYSQSKNGWQLHIPDTFYLGHEAHFGKVAETYFNYLTAGKLPDWEVPNMITKYFITTQARELALQNDE